MIDEIHARDLDTEEGVGDTAAQVALVVCERYLWPIADYTQPELRVMLFERFLSGIAGALCAHCGPDKAMAVLEAVRQAVPLAAAERRHGKPN